MVSYARRYSIPSGVTLIPFLGLPAFPVGASKNSSRPSSCSSAAKPIRVDGPRRSFAEICWTPVGPESESRRRAAFVAGFFSGMEINAGTRYLSVGFLEGPGTQNAVSYLNRDDARM